MTVLARLPLPVRRYLTTRQAADYCGVGLEVFGRIVREHNIAPTVLAGGIVRWDTEVIDRALAPATKDPANMTREDWLGVMDNAEEEGAE